MSEKPKRESACELPSGNQASARAETIRLSEEEWKSILPPSQFSVLRDHGTEPPFRNEYWDEKRAGVYVSAATGTPLFSSEDKFDSGTGWPSFTQPISPDVMGEEDDTSHGMRRVEVYSRDCGGHLGHVFPDGPPPTGLRYCINSTALRFVPVESDETIADLIAKGKKAAADRIASLTRKFSS